jgi:predicted metal-dependent phosphoesterase TrpH
MPRVRIDLHVHTRVSPDALDRPEALVRAARDRGLDGIAITDHDRGCAYNQLVDLGLADRTGEPVDGFLVIPGVEVSTKQGHVLVLGEAFSSPARAGGITAEALVHRARDRGLFTVAAHPFDRCRSGVGKSVLDRVPFDAVEVFNSKSLEPGSNLRAALYARQHGLPGVAGSDAHFADTIGRAHTIVDCTHFTTKGVLAALRLGQTAIHAGVHTPAELARYWVRGWFTRPWLADWACRAAKSLWPAGEDSAGVDDALPALPALLGEGAVDPDEREQSLA